MGIDLNVTSRVQIMLCFKVSHAQAGVKSGLCINGNAAITPQVAWYRGRAQPDFHLVWKNQWF